MKAIYYLLMSLFFFSPPSFAQFSVLAVDDQCLQNGDFAQYCGTTAGSCPYFVSPCVPNWQRSHGTPQIFTPGPAAENNMAFMWSTNAGGEGLFASYNFIANFNYIIRIRAGSQTPGISGSIRVAAANGLTETTSTSCGQTVPTPTSQQLITQHAIGGSWDDLTINFLPTSNYSQLWIYPITSSTTQYELLVDYAFVCPNPCEGLIIYNTGQAPANDTKAKDISAGSTAGSGGSGTVTVATTSTTTFIAANEIQLKPEFHASVSSGTFIARIDPCEIETRQAAAINRDINIPRFVTVDYQNIELSRKRTSFNAKDEAEVNLYPNPSDGFISIKGNRDKLLNSEISVYDQSGKLVFHIKNNLSGEQTINLKHLNKGAYYLQIKTSTEIINQKLIIIK